MTGLEVAFMGCALALVAYLLDTMRDARQGRERDGEAGAGRPARTPSRGDEGEAGS